MRSHHYNCKNRNSNQFHLKTPLNRLYFNYFKELFIHFNEIAVILTKNKIVIYNRYTEIYKYRTTIDFNTYLI